MHIAPSFPLPYYAVIFTAVKNGEHEEYNQTAQLMAALAREQEGFLGYESAGDGEEITVSYWNSLEAIHRWKTNSQHLLAQQKGKSEWYSKYKVRVCRVERDYGM